MEALRGQEMLNHQWIREWASWFIRDVDHRDILVMPLLFTSAIITVPHTHSLDYEGRWWYHTAADAIQAAEQWPGLTGTEPTGWHRHPDSGRRRPDGDPARERISH